MFAQNITKIMNVQLWLKMANLVFEFDKKAESSPQVDRIKTKMQSVLEEAGLFLYNPAGEKYTETRADLEANISGNSTTDLYVTDVIKPVVYSDLEGKKTLIQKGIVIVSGK